MPIRVVLADDHPIVLRGLEALLQLEPDFRVVASCASGEEALAAVRAHRPDVLVLDIRMRGKHGLTLAREIRDANLPTHVVIFAAALDDAQMLEAYRLGVRAIVLKEMAPGLLVQCLRTVHAGGQWPEKRTVVGVLDKIRRQEVGAQPAGPVLTPREIAVVRMVAAGLRNKEIGTRLAIGEGTVKVHLHHIYGKLKVDNRVALTVYARANDIA